MYLIWLPGGARDYDVIRLNPYSNGTMYLIGMETVRSCALRMVLILILMEQCI